MMYRGLGWGLLLLAVGCSSDDSPGDGDGGTGGGGGTQVQAGTGGSSGSGAGGGGGAGNSGKGGVTRAAVSLERVASGTCLLESSYLDLPSVADGHPVTASSKGVALEDGSTTGDGKSVSVSCTMTGTTSVFFDGTITIKSGSDKTLISLGGYPLIVGEPAPGGAVVSGPPPTGSYGAPVQTCSHTALEVDLDTHSVWVEVTCPEFVGSESGDVCEIGTSYYYFENCSG